MGLGMDLWLLEPAMNLLFLGGVLGPPRLGGGAPWTVSRQPGVDQASIPQRGRLCVFSATR